MLLSLQDLFRVLYRYHILTVLTCAHLAQEKETVRLLSTCGATLKYQVISCKLLFNLVSWPHLSRASTGGKGFYVLVPHSNGGPRPLANCRYSNPCVNIGTPQGTPRSWSGRSPHNLLQLDIRIEAIMGGGSTVLYYGNATREGVPSHATLNMMRQANLQQNFQRNELTTNFLP